MSVSHTFVSVGYHGLKLIGRFTGENFYFTLVLHFLLLVLVRLHVFLCVSCFFSWVSFTNYLNNVGSGGISLSSCSCRPGSLQACVVRAAGSPGGLGVRTLSGRGFLGPSTALGGAWKHTFYVGQLFTAAPGPGWLDSQGHQQLDCGRFQS